MPKDRAIDGVDVVPFLTGQAAGEPHDVLFWRSGQYRSVLSHDWKLQLSDRPHNVWLFDLKTDPNEHVNQAAAHPEKVAEMTALLKSHDSQQSRPAWPALLEGPIPIDRPLGAPRRKGEEWVYWDN